MSNFIFDFDGTLADSYPSIIDKLMRVNDVLNIHFSYENIFNKLIEKSTEEYINFICQNNNVSKEKFMEIYRSIEANLDLIILMPEVEKTIKTLFERGDSLFVYTHRGPNAIKLLEKWNIRAYFKEVIDSSNGFKRKPSGDAIRYLINKYSLSQKNTYYVGDRELDILCAKDANVNSIFYDISGIPPLTKPTLSIKLFNELTNIE